MEKLIKTVLANKIDYMTSCYVTMTVQVLPKNQLKRKTIRNLQEIFGFLELVGDFFIC